MPREDSRFGTVYTPDEWRAKCLAEQAGQVTTVLAVQPTRSVLAEPVKQAASQPAVTPQSDSRLFRDLHEAYRQKYRDAGHSDAQARQLAIRAIDRSHPGLRVRAVQAETAQQAALARPEKTKSQAGSATARFQQLFRARVDHHKAQGRSRDAAVRQANRDIDSMVPGLREEMIAEANRR